MLGLAVIVKKIDVTTAGEIIALCYPREAVDVKSLRRYRGGYALDIRATARDIIVAVSDRE